MHRRVAGEWLRARLAYMRVAPGMAQGKIRVQVCKPENGARQDQRASVQVVDGLGQERLLREQGCHDPVVQAYTFMNACDASRQAGLAPEQSSRMS